MTVRTKQARASVQPTDDPGEFDMILSNAAKDRDGDTLRPEDWARPLPEIISIKANHSRDVSDIVGSGVPFIDGEGNLRVRGSYASTPLAQHIRTLVNEGHLRSVSVELLARKDADGRVVNELVGGAFVDVPANPEARVLVSKAEFTRRLDAILAGEPDPMDVVSKAVSDSSDGAAMIAAIHDASVHLGAACYPLEPDEDPTGAEDGANKALALQLRLKAMQITSA
jgi:hypothetical protein